MALSAATFIVAKLPKNMLFNLLKVIILSKFNNTFKMTEIKCISWRDAFGSPYRYGLHPAMLNENGHNITATIMLKGQSKLEGRTPVIIHLDKDYAITYVTQLLLKKLFFQHYEEFESFMKEVWLHHENNR